MKIEAKKNSHDRWEFFFKGIKYYFNSQVVFEPTEDTGAVTSV
jgi:hypothetical protein